MDYFFRRRQGVKEHVTVSATARIGQIRTLEITLNNQTFSTLTSARIHLLPSKNWKGSAKLLQSVPPFETKIVNFECYPEAVGVEHFESTFTIVVTDEKKLEVAQTKVQDVFSNFLPSASLDQLRLSTSSPLNIYLFGLSGSGKSSLVQTWYTVFSEKSQVLRNVASVGGGSSDVTPHLNYYRLPGLNVSLWDTVGLLNDTYKKGDLTRFLQGEIPRGWPIKQSPLNEHKATLESIADSAVYRRAHAVIFILPCTVVKDSEKITYLQKYFDEIRKQQINPIILLGHVDTQAPEIRSSPFASLSTLESVKRNFSSTFKIPLNMIYYNIPYRTEDERQFNLEKYNYKILELAINNAISYISLGSSTQKDHDFTNEDLAIPKQDEGYDPEVKKETQMEEAFRALGLPTASATCISCDERVPIDAEIIHEDESIHHRVCCYPCALIKVENQLKCPKPRCGKKILKVFQSSGPKTI